MAFGIIDQANTLAKLEATRKNLEAVGPTLQQNAIWAVQGAIKKQGGYIATESETVAMLKACSRIEIQQWMWH